MTKAIIRTSDRSAFKRCRRKWGFSSHLNNNRTPSEGASYFWLGSGIHYAMEDYHGYNYYKHPTEAFRAYAEAWRRSIRRDSSRKLPYDLEEQIELGEGMLEYYLIWLRNREPYETLWVDGVPQVEVKCSVKLPFQNEYYDEVYYQATLDRIVVINDELWILDYKAYKQDWNPNLEFDMQMSAYIWLGSVIYDRPIKGAILQKHFKKLPKAPRLLASGRLSHDVKQETTYHMYRDTLLEMYGEIKKAPMNNRKCLDAFMDAESLSGDKFIQRAQTTRTPEEVEAIGAQVLMELPEMLNQELPLYKNDTKDCSWDCNFSDICVMMDQNADWESVLMETTVDRTGGDDIWRSQLPHIQEA